MEGILKRIDNFILAEQLFSKDDLLLVCVSGGADSVALLRSMLQLGYKVEAAHCNFHLRGWESNRDMDFVQNLCTRLGVTLHSTHFDTAAYASEHKLSIEMAARNLRYAYFEEIRTRIGAKYIVVAHHAADSVETMLINMTRGSGLKGMCGINPASGNVRRPLLSLFRSDIEAYLDSLDQDYVTDSTNLENDYTRNKFRNIIIPEMEKANPEALRNMASTAAYLRQAYAIYKSAVDAELTKVVHRSGEHTRISIEGLMACGISPSTLLFEIVHPLGFNATDVGRILASLTGQAGKTFYSQTHILVKDRNSLIIGKRQQEQFDVISIPVADIADLEIPLEDGIRLEFKVTDAPVTINKGAEYAYFDLDMIDSGNLTIRNIQKGDAFYPFGMKGRKLVSDYLTDRKTDLIARQKQLVLCSGHDIMWLIGHRPDNRFRITASTRRILQVHILF